MIANKQGLLEPTAGLGALPSGYGDGSDGGYGRAPGYRPSLEDVINRDKATIIARGQLDLMERVLVDGAASDGTPSPDPPMSLVSYPSGGSSANSKTGPPPLRRSVYSSTEYSGCVPPVLCLPENDGRFAADAVSPPFNVDPQTKPKWSYAALIGQAILSRPSRKISLSEIYSFIMLHYPYYKKSDSGWQNSIRHNLSLNECFLKTARGVDNPGKGCLWTLKAGCEDQFANGGFVKRNTGPKRKVSAKGDASFSLSASSSSTLMVPLSDYEQNLSSPSFERSDSEVVPSMRSLSLAPPFDVDGSQRSDSSQVLASQSLGEIDQAGVQRLSSSPMASLEISTEAAGLAPPPEVMSAPAGWPLKTAHSMPSPPTSVYNHAPGQWLDDTNSPATPHRKRALALMASPNANSGIIVGHDEYPAYLFDCTLPVDSNRVGFVPSVAGSTVSQLRRARSSEYSPLRKFIRISSPVKPAELPYTLVSTGQSAESHPPWENPYDGLLELELDSLNRVDSQHIVQSAGPIQQSHPTVPLTPQKHLLNSQSRLAQSLW